MSFLDILVLIFYLIGLSFIFLFCFTQLALGIIYLRSKRKAKKLIRSLSDDEGIREYPFVTVQLPVYNELYVVERLIDAVARFDYPQDRFEIQLLDDSTDETIEITKRKVKEYASKGINIALIQRANREGFKAGALQEGLKTAKGEFIAIFDADFVPQPEFLLQTLPHFSNAQIGLVQTKWKHLNKSYSLLTRVQAFALDAHFNIEQTGRNAAGAFMNFNGTAGVWRRSCIDDAGGWSFDTLTEDLDLSYRAQLKGWKFLYLNDVGSPAELPAAMSAVKSQQYRWSKGPAEVTKKMLGRVLFADVPFKVKWLSFFHLMNSSVNIFVLLTAVLSVPLLLVKIKFEEYWVFNSLYIFYSGILAIGIFYLIAQIAEDREIKKGTRNFLLLFPTFLSLSMGLSLHNGLAALKGLFGRKSPFIRTPKYNIVNGNDHWASKRYSRVRIDVMTILEVLMTFYFLYGLSLAIVHREFELLIFHFLLFTGFFSISYLSIKHTLYSTFKAKS